MHHRGIKEAAMLKNNQWSIIHCARKPVTSMLEADPWKSMDEVYIRVTSGGTRWILGWVFFDQ